MSSSIAQWLEELGLSKYADLFAENEIGLDILPDLTEADLKDLGIPLGDRKRLLKAVAVAELPEGPLEPEAAPNVAPEAERRQLTVMFCDLVGSTELSQAMDPEDLREVTSAYQNACKSEIERFGGYVAKYMGDGILAYFGYPHAHEDDADRAVRAALGVVEAVQSLDWGADTAQGSNFAVRVGIGSGLVVVGDLIGEGASQENAVIGETPNLAARLQSAAKPNQVLISSSTQSLVGAALRTESLGKLTLKGFAKPVEAWRVTGVDMSGGRFEREARSGLKRFVGRAAELEMLSDAWSQTLGGERAIVHIIGEPGIGKSRLVHEFRTSVGGPFSVLEGHCMSHGSATSFLPFIDMLRRVFELSDSESSSQTEAVISAAVREFGLSEREHVPYLLNLLGVTSPGIRGVESELIGLRTRQALTAVIRAHSRRRPTILYINDCHWIDKGSETLLETIAQDEELGVLLTLCSFRPEYHAPWDGSSRVRTIPLAPLSASEITLLFNTWFAGDRIVAKAAKVFIDWCGGNPLFAEELAHHLRQEGPAAWEAAVEDITKQATLVPETLFGLLLQRVDRLSQDTRLLLQTASVMGRRFRSDVVAEVAGIRDSNAALQEAARENLILRGNEARTAVYSFKHALVHDAIYSSLLLRDRSELHGAVARCLSRRFRGRESEIAEELARHFTLSEDFLTAARWAGVSGDKALALFAIEAAKSWYSKALDFLSADPEADQNIFADVLVNQLEVYCWEIDYPGMVELAEQNLSRVEALGGTKHVSRIFSWMGEAYINSGQFTQAGGALKRALEIGEELADPECIGYATGELMWLQAIGAQRDKPVVSDMEKAAARVLAIAEELDDRFLRTVVHYVMALDLAQRGYLKDACAWASQSVELGRETGYPPASSWGFCIRACARSWAEDYEGAVMDAREAVRVGQSKYDRLMAKMTLGSALVLAGNTAEGRRLLEEAKEERVGRSMIGFMYWPDTVYGLALLSSDDPVLGLEELEGSFRRFLDLGHFRAAGQVGLVIGEAYGRMAHGREHFPHSAARMNHQLSPCPPDAGARALESLKRALDLAQETEMDGVAAEALLGLAALANAEGRSDEARNYLSRAQDKARTLDRPTLERSVRNIDEALASGA